MTITGIRVSVLVLNAVLFVLDFTVLNRFGSEYWNLGWAVFFAQVLYLAASVKIVGPKECGAILLLGKPIHNIGSGPHFAPALLTSVEKETRLAIQMELPSDFQDIWQGDLTETPEGKKSPLRFTSGEGEGDDPLDRRMTLELVSIIRFKITDFVQFLTTIGGVGEARKQIEDLFIATITEWVAQHSPREVLAQLGELRRTLETNLDRLVGLGADPNDSEDVWGVDVLSTEIKLVDLPHTVNEALRDIPAATMRKTAEIVTAEGARKRLMLEGEGEASAKRAVEKAILEARAIGYEKIAEALGIDDKALVLMAETARATMEHSNYSFVAGTQGVTDIFALGGALQEGLSRFKRASQTADGEEVV